MINDKNLIMNGLIIKLDVDEHMQGIPNWFGDKSCCNHFSYRLTIASCLNDNYIALIDDYFLFECMI